MSGRGTGVALRDFRRAGIAFAVFAFVLALSVGVAFAAGGSDESGADASAGLPLAEPLASPTASPPFTLNNEEVHQLVAEMHEREREDEESAEDLQGLPRIDIGRPQALDLLNAAFSEQIEAAAGPLDSLDVDRFLSNQAAVVPAPGPAPGKDLLQSTVPLRARNDEGILAPVDLSLENQSGALVPENPLAAVEIPGELGEGVVRLPDTGITVELPAAPEDRVPSIVDGTASFSPNVATDTDLTVAPTATGVETFTQLRSAASPTSQTFHLDLPDGAQLRPTEEGGADVVRGEEVLLAINPPTATDAAMQSQPVAMEVSGDSLTLTVSPATDAAYPILVDPTMFEPYNWYSGTPLTWAAWHPYHTPYTTLDNGFTDPGYTCASWCGLYIGASNHGYIAGATSGANYNVPRYEEDMTKVGQRPTSWIQGLYSNPWGFWSGGEKENSPAVLVGLWSLEPEAWITNALEPPELSGIINLDAGSDHRAKTAVFSQYAWRTSYLAGSRYTILGSAWVYVGDESLPKFGTPSPSVSGWTNGASGGKPLSFTVTDSGLGVSSLSLSNGAEVLGTASLTCGPASSPCPRTWESSENGRPTLTYSVAKLPEGTNNLTLKALDPVGNTSTAATVQVKVDRVAPSVTVGGTVTQQSTLGTTLPEYRLKVEAADGTTEKAESGVAAVEVKLDGKVASIDPSWSPGCTTKSCSLSKELLLSNASLTVGPHELEVVAIDGAGNRSTAKKVKFTIERDTTKPQLTQSGPLAEAPEGWIEQKSYSYAATAKDPKGYGATSLELKIDGSTVASTTQTCAAGACELSLSKSISMTKYSGGTHTGKLIANDGAGNQATQEWTINVDPNGSVSNSEATATLQAVEETGPEAGVVASTEKLISADERADGNDPALVQHGATLESTGVPVSVTMTTDPSGGLSVEAPQGSIDVVPQGVTGGGTTQVTEEVAAVSSNSFSNVDEVARPKFDGVTSFQSIRDATAPTVYSWELDLLEGQTAAQVDEADVEVYWEDGTEAMLIAAEPARDAVGHLVPTTLTLSEGNQITLTVSHRSSGVIYPVVSGAAFEVGYEAAESIAPTPSEEAEGVTEPVVIRGFVGPPIPLEVNATDDEGALAASAGHRGARINFEFDQCPGGVCFASDLGIEGHFEFNGKFAWWKDKELGAHPKCPTSAHGATITLIFCNWIGANHQPYDGHHITALTEATFSPAGATVTDPEHMAVYAYGSGHVNSHDTNHACNPLSICN
jgi:hypothetical protein